MIRAAQKVSIKEEYICKDQKELPKEQHTLPYPEFLYGDKLKMTSLDINLSYEIFHNLFEHRR
jgi:hypothetical protein